MSNPRVVLIDKTESVYDSFIRDSITFGMLLLAMYVSYNSTIWTIICGFMFVVFLFAKGMDSTDMSKTFNSMKELKTWVNSLPEGDL